MQIHSIAEKVAAYLVAAPVFREHEYTVVSGVRVKDISLNGTPLKSGKVVDLLVCDGNRVLIGIAYRLEAAKVLNLDMMGLPYVRIPEADTALPLSSDDCGWMDYPSEACLEDLLKRVMESLSRVQPKKNRSTVKGRSLSSYRRHAVQAWTDGDTNPEGKIYTLSAVPLEQIIDKKPLNPPNLHKEMVKKHLLRGDFTPTPYGNAHGLFLRYHVNPFGDVFPELLTVPDAVKDIRAVLSWRPKQINRAGRISLAERKKHINHLPAIGNYDTLSAVKDLLNAPVDILFQNRTEDLQKFLNTLNYSRFLLNGEKPAGNSVDYVPIYWEALQMINSLRQGFGDEPLLDNDRSRYMRRACETLLVLLSEIFLTPPNADDAIPKGKYLVEKQSLEKRLADVHSRSVFRLFGVPLADYYQTISRLSECEYPNWVYRTRIRPVFENTEKPEASYNLRFLAAYCKVCQEDNGAHDWDETFPLLFDLIAIPVCIKHC